MTTRYSLPIIICPFCPETRELQEATENGARIYKCLRCEGTWQREPAQTLEPEPERDAQPHRFRVPRYTPRTTEKL